MSQRDTEDTYCRIPVGVAADDQELWLPGRAAFPGGDVLDDVMQFDDDGPAVFEAVILEARDAG